MRSGAQRDWSRFTLWAILAMGCPLIAQMPSSEAAWTLVGCAVMACCFAAMVGFIVREGNGANRQMSRQNQPQSAAPLGPRSNPLWDHQLDG